MFHITVTMYQLVGLLFSLLMPLAMLLGILWVLTKICKGFARSVRK